MVRHTRIAVILASMLLTWIFAFSPAWADDIETSLSNGTVKSIQFDLSFTSIILLLETSATEDGLLTIKLPRDALDSRVNGCTGDDAEFIVLVDGEEVGFDETSTTLTSRTLVIPINAGSEEVEIIGTCIAQSVGGEILSTDMNLLFVAGALTNAYWILPILGAIGACCIEPALKKVKSWFVTWKS